MKKKIFRLLLVIIWMVVIFSFSNQDGTTSQSTSEKVITTTVEVVKPEATPFEKAQAIRDYSFVVRKSAHFIEYLILGILIIRLLVLFKLKHLFIICLFICLIYASGDEIHQSFIGDRTPRVMDVLIDTAGSITGITVYTLIRIGINERKKNK